MNDDETENTGDLKPSYLDSSTLLFLEEAKSKVNGIVVNAMDWLRGSESIPVESFVRAILPFLNSKNPVVGTWALAFVQVSLEKISVKESSLSSSIIPLLIESLAQIHDKLLRVTESSAISTPLEAQWISVSWLLLDSIVLRSGRAPLRDWDKDWDVDSFMTTRNNTKNKDQKSPKSPLVRETCGGSAPDGQCANRGLISLVLDLLLYWPTLSRFPMNNTAILSPLGVRRMEHRTKINGAEIDDDEDEPMFRPDIEQQFQRAGLRRRTKATTEWSDSTLSYLRYMKLVCLEYAISLPSRGFSQELKNEHGMVLGILFASDESMHGRTASSYLKKLNAKYSLVSLSVVVNVLVLIVGEAQAQELLDSFEKQYETNIWEQLIVSKSNHENSQRPPIDWGTSLRAADFLVENLFNQKGSKKDGAEDEVYATLLIELSLKLSETNDDQHKYVAMRLVSTFYLQIERPATTLVCKVFELIIGVLTILANAGKNEEELRTAPRRDDRIAAGLVPMPFGGRNDLNQLLQSHRQSLKRRNLNQDRAIDARTAAYEMIPLLSAYMFERSDAYKFRLPILLLQCAVFEDRRLENRLTKALDSTLAEYKKKIDKDHSLAKEERRNNRVLSQQQATFLLPALLEAVCSGVEYVRSHAIQWIEKLLVNMDAEAAHYLAAHLIRDENHAISRMAKSIVDNTKTNSLQIVTRENFCVSIIDLKESDGILKVQNDLNNRSKELAQKLKLSSFEESMALLLHFKFSVKRAEIEYHKNPRDCREVCGLGFDEDTKMKEEAEQGFECGICYDEMEAKNAYSLRCGHTFCKTCWVSYATDASKEIPLMNFLDLRCPHHGCSTRVMTHDLQRLEPCLIPKWNDAIVRKFIEEDSSYRYCSGPDCGCVAVRSNQSIATFSRSVKVTCTTCTTSFCFGCGQDAHAPAKCQDITKWNHLQGSSQLWVKHHSKPCPGCNVPIEKNQGCNHIQCSHCNTDFCWLCLKILNSHLEPHTCNRYDLRDSGEDDFERQALFTFTRYEAHDTAAEFTRNQYKNFDPEKFSAAFWFLNEDSDLEIMDNALKTLLAGREFLKNSYVAMLGLRDDEKRLKLHEDHHGCLEMFTERLSQLTENNLHRLYTLQGRWGIRLHFRKLAFYTASVTKYTERMQFCESIVDT